MIFDTRKCSKCGETNFKLCYDVGYTEYGAESGRAFLKCMGCGNEYDEIGEDDNI